MRHESQGTRSGRRGRHDFKWRQSLMIGGFMGVGTSTRLIDELLRQGRCGLTVIAIRGTHLDVTVLGGLEIDERGQLANWIVPRKMVPAWAVPWTWRLERNGSSLQ